MNKGCGAKLITALSILSHRSGNVVKDIHIYIIKIRVANECAKMNVRDKDDRTEALGIYWINFLGKILRLIVEVHVI